MHPLISPEELREHLQDRNLVLLDTRPSRGDYEASHLQGALYASLNEDLSSASAPDFDPSRGGRHPLPSLEKWGAALGAWGITRESAVVVYDECDASNAAARAWWMLRASGIRDVRVLDGGMRAAMAAGLPIESGTASPARRTDPLAIADWQLPSADAEDVNRARLSPDWKVLDVRSGPRFRGETEPIDPIAGHIPGAVNLYFEENSREGRFKPSAELRKQYEELLAGTPLSHLIVHCGSGVTACQTLLALEAAGLTGASLYTGSWSEWCRNDLPREP